MNVYPFYRYVVPLFVFVYANCWIVIGGKVTVRVTRGTSQIRMTITGTSRNIVPVYYYYRFNAERTLRIIYINIVVVITVNSKKLVV